MPKRIIEETTISAVVRYMMELSIPKVPAGDVMTLVQILEQAPKIEAPKPEAVPDEPPAQEPVSVDDSD